MSEKPIEGAKEIEVTIKLMSGKTRTVKVGHDKKVSDLAKKVAEEFGFSKEKTMGDFKGFTLLYQGVDLAFRYNKQITGLNLSSFLRLMFVSDSRFSFDWKGELIKKEEEEGEEKNIVKPNENKSPSSHSDDKTEKKSSWPWSRITLGVMDSILLAAAITSYILGLHIAISIVLIVLFFLGTIGVIGWKNLLPKYLQKGINLGTDLRESDKHKEDNEKKPEKEEKQEINLESKSNSNIDKNKFD